LDREKTNRIIDIHDQRKGRGLIIFVTAQRDVAPAADVAKRVVSGTRASRSVKAAAGNRRIYGPTSEHQVGGR
jgi:hypothetical protein